MASKKKALDGKTGTFFWMAPEALTVIGIDTKHKSKAEHPLYDPRIHLPISDEAVKNTAKYGVIEAISVRKTPEGAVEVVRGRQRVRRAREANKLLAKQEQPLVQIKCIIERGSDEHLIAIDISSNELRTGDSILVKAAKAVDLMARGVSLEEVALTFGKSETAVNQWLALLEAPADVRKAAEEGVFSESAMVTLATLPAADAKEALATLKAKRDAGEKVTVADAKAAKAGLKQKAAKATTKAAKAQGKPAPKVEISTNPALPKRKIQKFVLAAQRMQKDNAAAPEPVEEGLQALLDKKDASLMDVFLLGMRVACGDRSTSSVKGFVDAWDEALNP